MSAPMLAETMRLRARIAELVNERAIRARDAYAVLLAEGWTVDQVDRVRRGVVTVRGITKGAWWSRGAKPMNLKPKAKRSHRRVVTAAAMVTEIRPPVSDLPIPPPRPLIKPPPPTVQLCRCGTRVGVRKPGESMLCLRCQSKEVSCE